MFRHMLMKDLSHSGHGTSETIQLLTGSLNLCDLAPEKYIILRHLVSEQLPEPNFLQQATTKFAASSSEEAPTCELCDLCWYHKQAEWQENTNWSAALLI